MTQIGCSRISGLIVEASWLRASKPSPLGVRLFDGEIRQLGARTVILLTWSRRAEPDQQADLDFAYDLIPRELGATLAPVGRVWQRVRRDNPDLELYAPDGSHRRRLAPTFCPGM